MGDGLGEFFVVSSEAPSGGWAPLLATVGGVAVGGVATVAAVRIIVNRAHRPTIMPILPGDSRLASLAFPAAPFEEDTVYVQHPRSMGRAYLPLAEFHHYLLGEKLREFLRIMQSLGARRITIARQSDKSEMITAGGSVGVPLCKVEAGVRSERKRDAQFYLEDTYARPPQPQPLCPEGLLWYPFETSWQSIVEARLRSHLRKRTVRFSYTESFGVNAKMAADIKAVGMSIGGEYKKTVLGHQEYEVEFFDKPSAAG